MPADADPKPERLVGRLVLAERSPGSKSERVAPLLELDDGRREILRRLGANPFHDPELEALEGQVLIVEGEHRGSHFLVRRYRVRGDDSPGGESSGDPV